ncbi:Uncharacterised protein [Bartonella grahamii]|uniref:Uncharacterized protein n=1 Tax=Bartonella grahamii TaxID=33045 RepID=A0A336NIJ4_BARGR|nr:Uncharacterised protein [Bartonella grahamii]
MRLLPRGDNMQTQVFAILKEAVCQYNKSAPPLEIE